MQRVLRYDGLLPNKINPDGSFGEVTPADIAAMKVYIDEHRTATTPFDIVVEGETPGDHYQKADEIVHPYAEAGATWWMEANWDFSRKDEVPVRIKQGPPRPGLR
jgi:hypothetical protein